MTFTSGAKTTPDIVNDIANALIASPTGYWTDADPTWNISIKTGNSARRALKYSDGTETIYLALEVINQTSPTSGIQFYYGNSAWYYGKGIRVIFSTGWSGNTYSGTVQSSLMPFESYYNSGVVADMSTMMVTYFLWYESNGFVIMGKPEPTGDNYQQSFIIAIERNPNKRYTDTYSSFYCFMTGNIWGNALYDGNWPTSINRNRTVLRPFAYQFPDYTGSNSWGTWGASGNGISFSPLPSYYAYKSGGNGKVYYIKPIVHNQANAITPIYQSELFFPWSENLGLIDGDIVAIQGQITKYLCKSIDSSDSTNRIVYAIKYLG